MNRKQRRSELQTKGFHNPRKKPLMIVKGNNRFLHFVQKILCKDGTVKTIEHMKLIKK